MIYGVKVILNDYNYKGKTTQERFEERYSSLSFHTNRASALRTFNYHLKKFRDEQKISFGRKELRGNIDFFIATVNDGQIMEHGKTIQSETVK